MTLWQRLVRTGFRLLYNQLAWSYDWVSRVVSKGAWQQWQQSVISQLHGCRVLDLGCGTGDLLLALTARGYRPWGIDASRRMLALAAQKGRGRNIQLGQGRAQTLPVAKGSFDSVTVTFPAEFIEDPRTHSELWRVIAPGGRLILADDGLLLGTDVASRVLTWLFRITSRPVVGRSLADALSETGFHVSIEEKRFPGSSVLLLTAEKQADKY